MYLVSHRLPLFFPLGSQQLKSQQEISASPFLLQKYGKIKDLSRNITPLHLFIDAGLIVPGGRVGLIGRSETIAGATAPIREAPYCTE